MSEASRGSQTIQRSGATKPPNGNTPENSGEVVVDTGAFIRQKLDFYFSLASDYTVLALFQCSLCDLLLQLRNCFFT